MAIGDGLHDSLLAHQDRIIFKPQLLSSDSIPVLKLVKLVQLLWMMSFTATFISNRSSFLRFFHLFLRSACLST